MELRQVIGYIESNNCLWAIRFEPVVQTHIQQHPAWISILNNVGVCNHCSHDTAKIVLASSFGKFQFMGFNIYGALGYRDFIGKFINDELAQNSLFNQFVTTLKINYSVDELQNDTAKRQHFAKEYNGPGNVIAYSARILDGIKHFRSLS